MSSSPDPKALASTSVRLELDGASRLPPLHSVTHDVHVLLESVGYLGIVLIDLEPLGMVEMEFGRGSYNELLGRLADELASLREEVLGTGDLLCTLAPFGEQMAFFLEGPRRVSGFSPRELEQLVDRIYMALVPRVASVMKPYGIHMMPRIGYALVLSNVMVQPERLIYRGLEEARRIAVNQERRISTRARESLRDILVKGQLRMVFQPVVELTSCAVRGYEALVRGPVASGFGTPAMLFQLANTANLTGELVRACFDCAYAQSQGLPTATDLFLNVTPALFNDSHFRKCMLEPGASALPPTRVVLELTESVAVRNYDYLHKSLVQLRQAGARVAIDDMGAGYANLAHVIELKPDYLKLDLSLVRDVHRDRAKRALIRSLLVASEEIGARIIAEGIEQREERSALADLGVPLAQGFLFGQPAPEFATPLVGELKPEPKPER